MTVITQCEIRRLYAKKDEPGIGEAIEVAKSCERRRCGHHPDEYPEPLSTLECFQSVVDPKDTGENKHRYVVASQNQDLRRMLREVRGVPLIYIKRSVMILEPMSDESVQLRAREERSKFRAELKSKLGKRKRPEDGEDEAGEGEKPDDATSKKKKSKRPGPKGPNPLSVKKAKKKPQADRPKKTENVEVSNTENPAKRKRRRKNKTSGDGPDAGGQTAPAGDDGEN